MKITIILLFILMLSFNSAISMEGYDYYTYINYTDTDVKFAWDAPSDSIDKDYYEVRYYDVGKKSYKLLGTTYYLMMPINFKKVGLYILEVRTCRDGDEGIKHSDWKKSSTTSTTKPRGWWINIFRKPPGTITIN